MTVKWIKNTDPYVIRYRIYGGLTSNPTLQIDSTTNASEIEKVFTGLVHGQTYYFRVTAVNDDGPESSFSNQATEIVKTGVVPVIKAKWGDVLICSNLGDSIASYQWFKEGSTILAATQQYYATNKLAGTYRVETIDLNGCKNPSNTISISGIKSTTIYPNPAKVSFALKIMDAGEGSAIISILNSSGIKVLELQAEYANYELTKEISVSNLDAGIYVVQVLLNRKDLYTTKLVVKK